MHAIFISAVFFIVGTTSAFGAESLSTNITHHYDSMRALGMGNAFTAVADDYSLIFYNPAGFANKKYNEVQFTLAGAGTSAKTLKIVDDIKKASDTQGTDAQKAEAISSALEEYYGKALGGKVQALEMFWVRKNWGLAILPADVTVDMSIDRQLGPAVDLNVKADTTVAYGYGGYVSKYLAAGITAQYVHRVAIEQSVSALELASNSDLLSLKRAKEGQLFDFDIGFLWTPNWFGGTTVKEEIVAARNAKSKARAPAAVSPPKEQKKREPQSDEDLLKLDEVAATPVTENSPSGAAANLQPTAEPAKETAAPVSPPVEKTKFKEIYKDKLPLSFGLVLHNVLGGSFSKTKLVNKDATEAPTKMYRVMDIGTQYVLGEIGDLTIRSMLDFRDLFQPEATFNKSFHAGLEFDYSPSTWFKTQFRGGVNQMYYTAGVTFLFGVLNIDAVTYGEEVGTISNKLENRVYAAKVGFNF